MASIALTAKRGRLSIRIGWFVSALFALLLSLDAAMKLFVAQPVIDASVQLGWPADALTIRALGAILALSTVLYIVPRTAVLGAILLTGWLGGAIATHARIADPLFTHTLFGVYVGVALWAGLWLRDARVRALIPFVS
jgi:hypothetical protein